MVPPILFFPLFWNSNTGIAFDIEKECPHLSKILIYINIALLSVLIFVCLAFFNVWHIEDRLQGEAVISYENIPKYEMKTYYREDISVLEYKAIRTEFLSRLSDQIKSQNKTDASPSRALLHLHLLSKIGDDVSKNYKIEFNRFHNNLRVENIFYYTDVGGPIQNEELIHLGYSEFNNYALMQVAILLMKDYQFKFY